MKRIEIVDEEENEEDTYTIITKQKSKQYLDKKKLEKETQNKIKEETQNKINKQEKINVINNPIQIIKTPLIPVNVINPRKKKDNKI